MKQTLFLGVATVLVAIGSFLASIQHRYTAYGFFVLAVVMVGFAVWAAYIEGVPKPHLVPIGYGTPSEHDHGKGLVFYNDGEPAYKIESPKDTPFGNSSSVLHFEEIHISRLSKDGGMQCFPMSVRDSAGRQEDGELRVKLILWEADSVLVSFRYADSRKPQKLRYTTVCKIIPTGKEVAIELVAVKFAWWML
jgi:hypothetical protein